MQKSVQGYSGFSADTYLLERREGQGVPERLLSHIDPLPQHHQGLEVVGVDDLLLYGVPRHVTQHHGVLPHHRERLPLIA